MRAGHVLIDGVGQLLSVDRGFGAIMQAEPAALVGRLVMDVTAPADRAECSAAIARLRETRQPFEISKRFLRDDGSLVWVTNTVSMVENGRDPALMVATISPMDTRVDLRAPALLLDFARMMVALRADRAEIFDRSLSTDIAWDAILAAYIAEAEGRAITVHRLADNLSISAAQAERWVMALLSSGSIEIETRESDPHAPKSFRLTCETHARLEDHLSKAGTLRTALLDRAAAQ